MSNLEKELTKKQNQTPALRFQGFAGEWRTQQIGSISETFSGGTPTVGVSSYYGGNIPFIRSAEINSSSTQLSLTEEGLANSSAKMVEKGSILYALYGATSGEVGIAKIKGAINQAVLNINPNKDFDAYFLMLWLRSQKKNIIGTFLQGGQGNLSGSIIKSLELLTPAKKEQQKIGSFFQQLDTNLAQHQTQLEKLKNLKQAMLQKMFPQNGAPLPEVRFKGFGGEWKNKSFGEVFEYERPDNYIVTSSDYSDKYKNPVLTANKAFILGYTNETNVYSNHCIIFDDFTLDSKYVDFPFMVKSSALKILTIKDKGLDDLYFSHYLLSQAKIEIMGHARHYISVVQPTKVRTPSLGEQQQIGNYFQKLDQLINQQQTQLNKLKQIKQACLEQMFV